MSINKKKTRKAKAAPTTQAAAKKLSRKQQKELDAAVKKAKRDDGVPRTAQQSIPFQRMFPDGICRVTDRYYTKTIQFQDINYQLKDCCSTAMSFSHSSITSPQIWSCIAS